MEILFGGGERLGTWGQGGGGGERAVPETEGRDRKTEDSETERGQRRGETRGRHKAGPGMWPPHRDASSVWSRASAEQARGPGGGGGGQGKKGPAQAGAQCFHPQMRKWAESSKAVPRGTSGSQDKNPPVRPHDTPHPTPRMRPRRELPSLSLSPQGSRTGLAILRCSKAGGSFLPRVGWTLL